MHQLNSPLAFSVVFLCMAVMQGVASVAIHAEPGWPTDDVKSVAVQADSLSSFFPAGDLVSQIKHSKVKAQDLEGVESALQIQVIEGKEPWSMGMLIETQSDIAKDDVLLATFQLRCINSMTGEALVNFVFQEGKPDWVKSAMVQVGAGSDWTRINVPFTAKGDYKAGEAMAGYHLSLAEQVLEIADFQVLNYGPGYDINRLPRTEIAYEGREADAAWRQVAQQRIDEIRKGELSVTVIDKNGKPVPSAKVLVEMTRHAFPFGTAVAVSRLLKESPNSDRYRQELKNNFNSGVFESAMKWNNHGTATPQQIAEALAWLDENNITMRGHVLMWPSWRWIHPEVLPLRSDPPAFRTAIEKRVADMTTLYRDQIKDWDVVNEAYSNHDVMDMYGDEIMADWFKLAHKANPEAELYINDNGILSAGGRETKHTKAYQKTIRELIAQGAPVGGIGMQGHFSTTLTSPEKVWATLDRFSEFGLPIKVTEFDVKSEDPQLQADYLRDFLTAIFAHPSIEGFVTWGFWERQHWRPTAAHYDREWNLRPHGKAYRDLVYKQWWTHEHGQTDAKGKYAIRGFLGDYRVVVTGPDGESQESTATLTREGGEVVVRLVD